MKLTDKQYRDAIDWVVTVQRGRFPIERGHIDAIADILLSPKAKAADEMFTALTAAKRFIQSAVSTSLVHHSTGKGGHDGDGSSWSEVAKTGVPDWAARQLIDDCDIALAEAVKP